MLKFFNFKVNGNMHATNTVITKCFFTIVFLGIMSCSGSKNTTENPGFANYLGNEGIMVSHKDTKILFDPFFHNSYNTYQLVPEDIRRSLFSGIAPYDNISAIFISHAHGDHFSSSDIVKFLRTFPDTQLIAPNQAIDLLLDMEKATDLSARMHAISLEYKDPPITKTLGNVKFDAVQIPHAGWPQAERAAISNLLFRVTLNESITVVHMGDADPNDVHFKPLIKHWEKQSTNTAFPPYWFMTSDNGQLILKQRIKAKENIGVHVPVAVPQELINTGEKYFFKPGQNVKLVNNKH